MIRPRRYLRSSLVTIRCNRHGQVILFHPGSGVILLTDTVGGAAARLLLSGKSDEDVHSWAEGHAEGAGARFTHLMDRLQVIGATTSERPRKHRRWWLRYTASRALGAVLSLLLPLVLWLPVSALVLLFSLLPKTPVAKRTLGQIAPYVDANLRASGYADTTPEWRRDIARACAAASIRTSFFLFLCLLLSPAKARRLTDRLIDPESLATLERTLPRTGGAVVVGMHTDLFHTPPLGMLHRGWPFAILAEFEGTDVTLAADRGTGVFGAYTGALINSQARFVGKSLIDRLSAGEYIAIAFDAPVQRRDRAETTSSIGFMGRSVNRFNGPAWLAVRSGKPVVFVGTFWRGGRVVLDVMPPVNPDATLPRQQRIEALTTHIYATGEAFVRRHPDAWLTWSYLHELLAPNAQAQPHGENVYAGLGDSKP